MSSTRIVWLVMCVVLVAFVAGCGGGSEPAAESEEASAPPPAASSDPAEESASEGAEEEAAAEDVVSEYPIVEMRTSFGSLKIELYPDKAPKTVDNFLSYVRGGFYDGTIFHRVVPGFVIQGGGFTADMTEKDTEAPVENEADNGLLNARGTICMARTPDPHSATSQFFINTVDNPALDFRDRSQRGWGYAVFGKVIEGIEIVDEIEGVSTTTRAGHQGVPVDAVIIESARVVS